MKEEKNSMILFFDTETTGKADFRSPPDAPHQPRLVQFAALLTEDSGEEIASANLIIKPNGFEIPEEASAIHGITTQMAQDRGVECSIARGIYRTWWNAASMVVGHNVDFDLLVMDGELFRKAGGQKPWGDVRNTFCTMKAMTPICKIENPYGYDKYKWPKLQEAYKHCFGTEFDGAHDAMADVLACAKVYFWIKQNSTKS